MKRSTYTNAIKVVNQLLGWQKVESIRHLPSGIPEDVNSCPVALALVPLGQKLIKDQGGLEGSIEVKVGANEINIKDSGSGNVLVRMPTPPAILKFVEAFDRDAERHNDKIDEFGSEVDPRVLIRRPKVMGRKKKPTKKRPY